MCFQWPAVESGAVVIPTWSDKHRRLRAHASLNPCASTNRWCTSNVLKAPAPTQTYGQLSGYRITEGLVATIANPKIDMGTTRHIDISRQLQFEAHPEYDQFRHRKQ